MIEAFRAEMLTLPEDPARAPDAAQHFADGLLVVEDGIVAALGDLPRWRRVCGVPITALPGLWCPALSTRISIIRRQTASPPMASNCCNGWNSISSRPKPPLPIAPMPVAAFFIEELLRNGTTSALVFATVHEGSVDALFEAALARNMRMVSGKVLMDLGPKGCATRPKPRAAKARR
jgi:guanine deaminase